MASAKKTEKNKLLTSMENQEEESANKFDEYYNRGPLFVVLGYLCSFMLVLSVVTGDATAQAIEGKVSVFQLTCHRYIVESFLITPVLVFKQIKPVIQGWTIAWTLFYVIIGQVTLTFLYSALNLIPLGTVSTIENTAKLWLSVIFSRIFLKDKINIIKVLAVILSTVGIICVLQPPGLFPATSVQNDANTNNFFDYIDNKSNIDYNGTNFFAHNSSSSMPYYFASSSPSLTSSVLDPGRNLSTMGSNTTLPSHSNFSAWSSSAIAGYLLAAGTGTGQSARMVLRPGKLFNVSTPILAFWNSIMCMLLSFSILFTFSRPVFYTDTKVVGLIFGNAIAAGLIGPLFIASVTFVPPTTVSSIMVTMIILMFILQYTLLSGEFPESINAVQIIGVVLVAVALIMTPFFYRFSNNCWKPKENTITKTEGSLE